MNLFALSVNIRVICEKNKKLPFQTKEPLLKSIIFALFKPKPNFNEKEFQFHLYNYFGNTDYCIALSL